MRRRSGALHCDSQEDFMQLAEASHNHIGIFYDEKMNKRVMHQFKNSANAHKDQINVQVANPELSAEKKRQDYRGFEFGLESDSEKEEREELERVEIELAPSQGVALICMDVSQLMGRLTGSGKRDATSQQRWLDLVIAENQGRKEKWWLFSKDSIDTEDSLVQLYLNHCKIVLDCSDKPKIIRNGSCESDGCLLSRFSLLLQN